MDLIIGNKQISASIFDILVKLKKELNGEFLSSIIDRGDNVFVSCPFHKGGKEAHPSCGIYSRRDNQSKPFGLVHCFTCGYSATLEKFVGDIFHKDESFGESWLAKNFGDVWVDSFEMLGQISIEKKPRCGMQESILDKYDYYHPYMWERGLSKEVVDRFRIGYDKEENSITFPIWDEFGALVGISKRCVESKKFYLEHGVEKPVYLLNYIKQCGITTVVVCEGQFDALVSWSFGVPAVALFGAGTTQSQMDALNRSCVRHYILMYDNDDAGRKGSKRFKKLIRNDVFVTDIIMPKGKDVGSCSKDDFFGLLENSGIETKFIST